ncbi:hypothetical protein EHR04_06515 [Leptospira levettii]|uniref:LIC_11366 family protein n=1 Tax=Leptospira levettii TaxID=2023178 RepID=UPI0010838BB5|nr:hypothetical protein [Leptospira levettii]MCG6149714.1 hypothetical protein [Leptospira levettii]TGM31160.1 hypothetical protein EHQ71_07265 [Leptospira levettii]TGM38652.1 hypothetical protein EHQ75_10855 [Leptospira levettii]TGM75238.1 hypothetical protein EHR04_06515 [Leptospira levettii]TGM85840.1 hypothetical protein EHR00_02735 [Leptospira levettii]
MSRCIVILSFPVFLFSFLTSGGLTAEPSGIEVGMRYGAGERIPGRFDGDLRQFSSTFNPLVFSDVNIKGGKTTNLYEGFIRFLLDSRNRVGFYIGRNDWQILQLTEVTSDLYYTKLNSEIYSYHVLGMYHFSMPISRNFEWENGVGMGFTSADWNIRGYSIGEPLPNTQYFNQRGRLRGSGLVYRVETAINRRLYENTFFQIGIGYHHIAIDKFSGNYNGETSSFYIRADGRVGVIDDTRIIDATVSTAQTFRRLDMNTGAWTLYFSAFQRFLD